MTQIDEAKSTLLWETITHWPTPYRFRTETRPRCTGGTCACLTQQDSFTGSCWPVYGFTKRGNPLFVKKRQPGTATAPAIAAMLSFR